MVNAEAIYKFFSSFGMPAYVIGNVPDLKEITYPYLTYESVLATHGSTATTSVSIWFNTNSEAEINDRINAIMRVVADGVTLPCDGGMVFIYCNEAWQSMLDVESDAIKRRYATFNVMFNTI